MTRGYLVCSSQAEQVRPSLFEFAGGEQAFQALAVAHHARCLADPELNHPFSRADQNPQHVQHLAAYWAEVLGVDCFVAAAEDAGLPRDPEFRAALRASVVWAVDDVLSYPEKDDVPHGVTTPRWSWDGLQTPSAAEPG